MKNSYTPEVRVFVNTHQQVTPNHTNKYSLVSPNEVHDLPVGSYGSLALTRLFFYFINRKHIIKIWRLSATPFLYICMCSVFSHFWTNINLSSGKMDVIQVLAARVASVNSLFHIWVFSLSCWCWENLMSFGYSPPPAPHPPYPGQIQPGLLSASAAAEPHSVLPRLQHPSAAVGLFLSLRPASPRHLKLGPAVILSLHPEGAE